MKKLLIFIVLGSVGLLSADPSFENQSYNSNTDRNGSQNSTPQKNTTDYEMKKMNSNRANWNSQSPTPHPSSSPSSTTSSTSGQSSR